MTASENEPSFMSPPPTPPAQRTVQLHEISLDDVESTLEPEIEHKAQVLVAPASYFWVGLLLTLLTSIFSLLALMLHDGLRGCSQRRRRYLYGVALACGIHGVALFIAFLYFLTIALPLHGHPTSALPSTDSLEGAAPWPLPEPPQPDRISCSRTAIRSTYRKSSDVGTSYWLPTYVVLLTRIAISVTLAFLAAAPIAKNPAFAIFIFAWASLAQSGAFVLLSMCSILSIAGWHTRALANFTLLLYQTASTLALFNLPIGVLAWMRKMSIPSSLHIFPPLAAFVLDIFLLATRVQFRFNAVWAVLAVLAANISLLAIVTLREARVPISTRDAALLVLALVVLALWAVFANAILVGVTRVPPLIWTPRLNKRKTESSRWDGPSPADAV